MTTTKDVLMQHLTAFGNNDLDAIMEDYTEESELLTAEALLKGLDAIRRFFSDYFITIPTSSDFEMKQLLISGELAYIVWASRSTVAHIPLGTDTFFISDGKIKQHTVAAFKRA